MKPQPRSRRPVKIWEEKEAPVKVSRPRTIKKSAKAAVPQLETQPTEDPPTAEVKAAIDDSEQRYTPPITVGFELFKVQIDWREPIDLFLFFLDQQSLLAIVAATNIYANSQMGPLTKTVRSWSDLTVAELLCWLGLLFSMAKGTTVRRSDFWPSFHPFMAKQRWDQIHRYLTFNIDSAVRPLPAVRPKERYPW